MWLFQQWCFFPDEIIILSDHFRKHQKGKCLLDEGKTQVNVMAYLTSNEMLFCPFGMPKYFIKVKINK